MTTIAKFLLNIYAILINSGAKVSVTTTAFLFFLFSKLLIIILGKKSNSTIFILFPFDNLSDWKDYIGLFNSFSKKTSYKETYKILFYKYRTNINKIKQSLPYFRFPGIDSSRMFYDANDFPSLRILLDEKDTILDEYLKASKYQKSYVDEIGNKHEGWQTIFLYTNGILNEKVKDNFPQTYQILKKIHGLDNSMILFSVLKPYSKIPIHTGPFNFFLRVHLPLIVPTENQKCFITVGNETNYWQQNNLLIFDDSYEHAVENNTNEIRVVLLLAIEKNNINKEVRILSKQFMNVLNKSILFNNWMQNNA